MRNILLSATAFLSLAVAGLPAAAAPVGTVLHQFGSVTSDGLEPNEGIITDSAGNIYMSTIFGGADYYGTVIKFSKPSTGQTSWTETILHEFPAYTGDGARPFYGVTPDAAGNLYVVTYRGGTYDYGTIAKLSPPAAGQTAWTEEVIYSFNKSERYPGGPAYLDGSGNLYVSTDLGGTQGLGSVVEVSPPKTGKTKWTAQTIYSFGSGGATDGNTPAAGLIADSAGNLYTTTWLGGTANDGTIVKLSPPASSGDPWVETVLYNFQGGATDGAYPFAPLIFDGTGNLYTTTQLGGASTDGAVIKLAPPHTGQTAWTESLIYSVPGAAGGDDPMAPLTLDKSGNLYTTAKLGGVAGCGPNSLGCGAIIKISRPAAGGTAWTGSVLYLFDNTDGAAPEAGLAFDSQGNLYTPTSAGGSEGEGVLFELAKAGFTPPKRHGS